MSAIEQDQDIQFGTLYIDSMYKWNKPNKLN